MRTKIAVQSLGEFKEHVIEDHVHDHKLLSMVGSDPKTTRPDHGTDRRYVRIAFVYRNGIVLSTVAFSLLFNLIVWFIYYR